LPALYVGILRRLVDGLHVPVARDFVADTEARMARTFDEIELAVAFFGQAAALGTPIKGWVSVRRDQGKMVFFDFSDRSGSVQGVVCQQELAIETAKEIRNEYVVQVERQGKQAPRKKRNDKVQNGDIELEVKA
jgi:lysyl-tRNA synthetase class II